MIVTIAGNGTQGNSGIGGPASSCELDYPLDAVFDHAGNLYITDSGNDAVKKIDANGNITHVATIYEPVAIACDKHDNLFVISQNYQSVMKISPTGSVSLFAGMANGTHAYSGDGGPATSATLDYPYGLAIDTAGNVFISTNGDARIRKVNTSGIITTIAGNGQNIMGPNGNNGPATAAYLASPRGIAFDKAGNLYVAEQVGQVRRISTAGVINKFAGDFNLGSGYSGDGSLAKTAQLNGPVEVAVDSTGNVYISDMGNQVIRMVNISSGIISTYVGSGFHGGPGGPAGQGGYGGDGGPLLACRLNNPWGLTFTTSGELVIVDWFNHRVRKITTPTFVGEIDYQLLFSVYPNPAKGLFQLKQESPGKVRINNALGQEILSETLPAGEHRIDLRDHAPGIYALQVIHDGRQQTLKLIHDN
ncbi:MAG: T9SS type A sorting domain-containing protein, partial [Bacteroidia bacterium]|nr:T9SS type A sorting domain-containing protein [Bacteroidia bacterium]